MSTVVGDMDVFAANLLQSAGLALALRSLRGGSLALTSGDAVFAMLVAYKLLRVALLQQPQAFRLLTRRCGNCTLLLPGECLLPAPGLTTEVNGATTSPL